MDRLRRSDCTAGQRDGEAGWWTTSGNIGLPPLARVMGVGRQQQQVGCKGMGGVGDKGREENQCWWDVEDKVEGKGTGGEKDPLVVVEDEGNGGGVGDKGRE